MLRLAPSRANRWVPCPGSVQMEDGKPDGERSPVADEGVALAWACEQVILSWRKGNEPIGMSSLLGSTCPENGVVIDAEMVHGGMVFLEAVWGKAFEWPKGLLAEAQLTLAPAIEKCSGRADALWRSENATVLVVDDLKYGYAPVDAFDNWQLIWYGLAALQPETKHVVLRIIQPRGPGAGSPVKTWKLSAANLHSYYSSINDSATLARGPNPPTHPGPWCRNCKAAAHCEALQRSGYQAMEWSGSGISVDLDPREVAHELEMLHRATAQLKARSDALAALAIARIKGGEIIPGYEHRSSMGNRRWTMTPDATIAMGSLFNVDLAEPPKAISPAQAEAAAGLPRATVDLFTTRRENAPTLKRIDPKLAREVFQHG